MADIDEGGVPQFSAVTQPLFQASTQDDQSMAQMVALLNEQDAMPATRRLHDWAIERADVRPGDRVVDLGSGTGTMSIQLARLVVGSAEESTGQVTGIEPNARLRALAAARAEADGVFNVSFVDGLAGALPIDDSSIDLVWCERVLQHVADPQAAVDDMARVLRPGGRVVILDSDHGTRIVSAVDQETLIAFNQASLKPFANPYAARHVPVQIRKAGLVLDPDLGSSAFIFTSEMLLHTQMLQRTADDAVESGGLARDVADATVRAVHEAAEQGDAFAAVTVFGFVARKLPG